MYNYDNIINNWKGTIVVLVLENLKYKYLGHLCSYIISTLSMYETRVSYNDLYKNIRNQLCSRYQALYIYSNSQLSLRDIFFGFYLG